MFKTLTPLTVLACVTAIPKFDVKPSTDQPSDLAGPVSPTDSARATPSATRQFPVDDLEAQVARLREQGVEFRNDIVENQGRKQILCSGPSGNIVELFQAP